MEGSMRDNWKCQSKLQKKQPYRKQQPLGGNPRTNPVHKNRKCHRVKIFTFLIASYDEAARVRMQTNRILFAWLSTDAGIDEKGVGVMCLQHEETSWFLYQLGAQGRLDSEASSSGVTWQWWHSSCETDSVPLLVQKGHIIPKKQVEARAELHN